jgi:two-component system chemotaxis response regulator CheY
MKVIVADDSRVMRQIVIRTLRQAGFGGWDIVEAVDGADALDKVSAEDPDLVLSDWNMPNMTGIELLRSLRSAGNEVSFAFVTSEGSAEMRTIAADAGALGLIAKPFTPDSFSDIVELWTQVNAR